VQCTTKPKRESDPLSLNFKGKLFLHLFLVNFYLRPTNLYRDA